MSEDSISVTETTTALQEFAKCVEHAIHSATDIIRSVGEKEFSDEHIGKLWGPIQRSLQNILKSMHCSSEEEFLDGMKRLAIASRKSADLNEALEEYYQSDQKWGAFLDTIDQKVNNASVPQSTGIETPTADIALESLEIPNKEFSLGEILSESKEILEKLGCQVVIVSFGVRQGAERWKEDANCPFPIYLDPKRIAYNYFGMPRSLSKVWGMKTTLYYACLQLRGTWISPYEDIEDDRIQMGGDIVFDTQGNKVVTYLSQSSPDRPTVQFMLDSIRKAYPEEKML